MDILGLLIDLYYPTLNFLSQKQSLITIRYQLHRTTPTFDSPKLLLSLTMKPMIE
jgi:hypothetical protein